MKKIIILIVIYLLLISAGQILFIGTSEKDLDIGQSTSVIYHEDENKVYHFATRQDIDKLKAQIGVREPGKNYNMIVDGHGTGLAPPTEESWESYENSLLIVDEIKSPSSPGPGPSPSAVDMSTDQHFPAIGNQGWQGSCSAWAMTYYTYGYLEAKDQGWTGASMNDSTQLISPAWTYNKVNGGNDWGSSTGDNGLILQDWGGATLSTMSYDDKDHLSWGNASAFREAPLHKGGQIHSLGTSTTVDDIKTLMDTGYPVTFGMNSTQYNSSFADGNNITSSVEYDSSLDPNHAQTIVGYDDSITDDGEQGAFRIANSWGTNWGDKGFYWLTYDAFRDIRDNAGLFLKYIDDISDYNPSLLATWHFNDAPTRDANTTLGIGPHSSPNSTKYPYYEDDTSNLMPTYLSLDVTEFQNYFDSGETRFFLEIGMSMGQGVISSFKLEHYDTIYVRGRPTQVTLQSPDVPRTTQGYVTNQLYDYTSIDANEALDNQNLTFTTGGVVGWTGVEHESYDFVDSMQSGDVGDGEISYIETTVTAPISVSWSWKVDAEDGDGLLLYFDGSVVGSMFGFQPWIEHSIDFTDSNPHTIRWEFVKNNNLSMYQDAAWLDNVQTYQKMDIQLFADGNANNWNFVSFNLIPLDTSITEIMHSIDGSYDKLMYYEAANDRWRTYVPGRADHYNDIYTWDNTMGMWISMFSDDVLTIKGNEPTSTNITLYPGWNMVGLPSSIADNHNLPPEIIKIGFFDQTRTSTLPM